MSAQRPHKRGKAVRKAVPTRRRFIVRPRDELASLVREGRAREKEKDTLIQQLNKNIRELTTKLEASLSGCGEDDIRTAEARIVSEIATHDPYGREAEHALHKKCAMNIIRNLATCISRGILVPGGIEFDRLAMALRNVQTFRTSSWRWMESTLQLAAALRAASPTALRLMSGTVFPNYDRTTATRLATTNMIFPANRSAPVRALTDADGGLGIDKLAMKALIRAGKKIEILRVDGTMVSSSKCTDTDGKYTGACVLGAACDEHAKKEIGDDYDADDAYRRYIATRERAKHLLAANSGQGLNNFRDALRENFMDEVERWRDELWIQLEKKKKVIKKHEARGLQSARAWARMRGVLAEEKTHASRIRESIVDVERLRTTLADDTAPDDDGGEDDDGGDGEGAQKAVSSEALAELFLDVVATVYDAGVRFATELVLVVATDCGHTYDTVVARFAVDDSARPRDVHAATLAVARAAREEGGDDVAAIAFDGEFSEAWEQHGVAIDALARECLDDAAKLTSRKKTSKQTLFDFVTNEISSLNESELVHVGELLHEALADGDADLVPPLPPKAGPLARLTVHAAVPTPVPAAPSFFGERSVDARVHAALARLHAAIATQVTSARFADHVSLLLFLARGVRRTGGAVFDEGWCPAEGGGIILHEDSNHKIKNLVQGLRRQSGTAGSTPAQRASSSQSRQTATSSARTISRSTLTATVRGLLDTMNETESERRAALALCDTVLNEKIDAQSTTLAETLLCNEDLHDALKNSTSMSSEASTFWVAVAKQHEAFVAPGLCEKTRRSRLIEARDAVIRLVGRSRRLVPATWKTRHVGQTGIPRSLLRAFWFNCTSGIAALEKGIRLTALSTDAVEKLFGMLVSRAGYKPHLVAALQVMKGVEARITRRQVPSVVHEPVNKQCHPFTHRVGSTTRVSGAWANFQPPVDDDGDVRKWYVQSTKTATQHVSSAARATIRNNVHRRSRPADYDDDDEVDGGVDGASSEENGGDVDAS